jgi:hypothetical protein
MKMIYFWLIVKDMIVCEYMTIIMLLLPVAQ